MTSGFDTFNENRRLKQIYGAALHFTADAAIESTMLGGPRRRVQRWVYRLDETPPRLSAAARTRLLLEGLGPSHARLTARADGPGCAGTSASLVSGSGPSSCSQAVRADPMGIRWARPRSLTARTSSLATSASQEPDATVSLQITGDSVVLTQGSATVEGTLGQPGATEYVLCPPDGEGSPRPLDAPLDVGGVRLTSPALFGDCGQTKPVRVTLVDLDATTEASLPFQDWAEFCDTKDPDC